MFWFLKFPKRILGFKSSPNLAPFDRSHCDSCDAVVVYAVSEEGRALVLALYPDIYMIY
jgi:hypothetical protein